MTKRVLIDQLADFETAVVANAITALGLSEAHTYAMDGSIACQTPDLPPMVGRAITIRLDSCTPGIESDNGPYNELLDQIEDSDLPHILVVQTSSKTPLRECVLGDGMAKNIVACGGGGFVTDGGVRDMRGVMDQGLCVFAPRQTVQHGNMCWSDLGAPVEIGSVTVKTGDLLHGDYGGCITVPEANHPWIVAAGSQVMDFEKQAHLELRRTDLRNHQKRKLMQEISAEHARRIAAIKAG